MRVVLPQIMTVQKKYLVLIISLLFNLLVLAQNGKITGKVLNSKNEPLAGVSVKIVDAPGGVTTDIEGRFTLTVTASGKSQLEFSAIGYNTKTISDLDITTGRTVDLPVVMDMESKQLSTVVITATRTTARRESINSLIQFQKNTNTVAQVVAAESIRKSPDRNTGDVLKRVPGISIQEGKYIVVRGLPDRYNQATINGALLSSTEPDRKTFSFDIFPSNIIDNIIINKAALPEMPSEFAGGLIQINTKDVPSEDFFNFTVGTGFNTYAVKQKFVNYDGSQTDFIGLPGKERLLPGNFPNSQQLRLSSNAEKAGYGQQLSDTWQVNEGGLPAFINSQFTGGLRRALGKKNFGVIYSAIYNRQARFNDVNRNYYEGDFVTPKFEFNDKVYQYNTLMGALANFSLTSGRNKFSWKNSYSINSNDQTILRTGVVVDSDNRDRVRGRELGFTSNRLYNTQLAGDHVLSNRSWKFRWNANYALLEQDLPDLRRLTYTLDKNDAKQRYFANVPRNTPNARIAGRFFSTLHENVLGGQFDISKDFQKNGLNQQIKVGSLYQYKDRDFVGRGLGLVLSGVADAELRYLQENEIFKRENYSPDKFFLEDVSTRSDSYIANSNLIAGFIQMDNQFSQKIRFVWGIRYEWFRQELQNVTPKQNGDPLPSFNLTFKLNNKTNIRLSGSQTLSRPEFREISPFEFYDYERNAQVRGATDLSRAKITNGDLRYEIYPQSGELITLGVFYKHFENPIESIYSTGQGGPLISLVNAKSAYSFGAEFEFRKRLDFMSNSFFNKLAVLANASLIKSEVKFRSNYQGVRSRPLQGQSPYLINTGLQYDNENSGTNASVLFNLIGRRIAQVGDRDYPDIWENPRPILDFQFTQQVSKKMDIKLSVSDILNKKAIYYWDNNEDKQYSQANDRLINGFRYGTNVTVQFNFKF